MAIPNVGSPNVARFPTRARATYLNALPDNVKAQGCEYNYYYYIRAREHIENDVQEIADMYLDIMGRPMPRFVLREVQEYMQNGIGADMISAVLAYTGGAPRPSWAYARAVIDKQAAMGARTAAEFNGNVSRWRASKVAPNPSSASPAPKAKRVIEQQYEQRHYDPEELNAIPEDLLAEMR